jgi:CRP-like cAMP-binding protein
MQALEAVLQHLSIFAHLRPDEIGRAARLFEVTSLATGAKRTFDEGRLAVAVGGTLRLEVQSPKGALRSTMDAGDHFGLASVVTDYQHPFVVEALEDATIACVDRAGFDRILAEFPSVSLPLASELSRELAARHDLMRQLLELHAERLPAEELAAAVAERRDALQKRGARVSRMSPRALFRRLVVQRGEEPPFWMLVGFIASLGLARLVVFLILKYKLEKQLFALVPGNDPNPMHVHHFNYGLVLIGAAGLAALFPFGRRALRFLALAFGFGCGLVFDEFALFWNLNPEYAQGLSLIAAGIAGAVLAQLVWFRQYWKAIGRRVWLRVQGVR